MSKSVTIPSNMNPWVCNINGVVYSYKAGSTQTVPDEVASLIENINAMTPTPVPDGAVGQVWTRNADGTAEWKDIPEYELSAATETVLGGVKMGAAVADAASTAPTAAEFKALLDSLRGAGIIATEAEA